MVRSSQSSVRKTGRSTPAPNSAAVSASRVDTSSPVGAIGALIRESRHGRFTLEELAERSRLSIGLLSEIERGHGNPSLVTLLKIAYALDLPLGHFFQDIAVHERQMVVYKHSQRTLVLP